jgi:hypothetical protein
MSRFQRAIWRIISWAPVVVCTHEIWFGVVPTPVMNARADDGVSALVVSRRARLTRGSLVIFDAPAGDGAALARVRGLTGDYIFTERGVRRLLEGEVWVVSEASDRDARATEATTPQVFDRCSGSSGESRFFSVQLKSAGVEAEIEMGRLGCGNAWGHKSGREWAGHSGTGSAEGGLYALEWGPLNGGRLLDSSLFGPLPRALVRGVPIAAISFTSGQPIMRRIE